MISEPAQAERGLEHHHSDSGSGQALAHESPLDLLSTTLGTAGSAGDAENTRLLSSTLLQRRANGEVRALLMRRVQQAAGNRRTQQMVAQLRRGAVVQRHCDCGGSCVSCRQAESMTRDSEEEDQPVVQRQPHGEAAQLSADVIPSNSPGQTLDSFTRAQMETHFAADLDDVRVHTDSAATQSAIDLQANAYTVGQDIYFAPGQYHPQSSEGAKLLAHELTHTRQQAAGEAPLQYAASRSGDLVIGAPDDPLEREAEESAEAFTKGESGKAPTEDSEGALRRDIKDWTLTNNPLTHAVATGTEAASEFIGATIERIAPGATAFFHGLREFFDDALSKGVDGLFGGVLASIKEKGIAGTLEAVIGSAASGIFKAIGSFVAGKCAALGELAEHLVELAAKLGSAALEQVKKGFDQIGSVLENIWSQYGAPALDWIKNKLKPVWKGVEDTARRFWDLLEPLRKRLDALWDKAVKFLIEGRRKFEEWLEVVIPKAIAAWEALKLKLKPHMEQIKTAAKVAGVVALLLSPAGPIVLAGGAVYLLYLGIKAFWDRWGKPAEQAVRKWWLNQALPSIERKLADFKDKVESVAQRIRTGLSQLYEAFMKVLDAAGVLGFLKSVKAAIQSVATKVEAFKEAIGQKLDEWSHKIASLLVAALPYLHQIREFLRQTLLIAVLGPLAFLDDGVWHTVSAVVALAMRTPCLREIAGLLRVPPLLERLGHMRAGIKQGLEIIKNPDPLLEQFKTAIQPMVDKIEPEVRSRVSTISAGFTERELFIQLSVNAYLANSLSQLRTSWWSDLKKLGRSLLWPWDEVGKEFMPMLGAFGAAISALFDLEISKAIDSFLDGMKKFNGIVGVLSGWFMIASVLLGAALGAFGFTLGPVGGATVGAGASAGLAFAESVGFSLLLIAVVTEGAIVDKSEFDIRFQNPRIANEAERKKADQEDCKAIAGSLISLVTIGALMLLGSLASKFAKFLWSLVEDLPLISDVAELLKSAKEKVADFSFKKDGEPLEGKTPGTGLDDTARKLEDKGVPREQFEREMKQLRQKLVDPNNVRRPADPRYDAEIDVKDGAEDHTYDRDKADRTWCRHSNTGACDLDVGSDVNSKVDEDLQKKSGDQKPLTPEEAAALKNRPDVQRLLQKVKELELPWSDKEVLDYLADDPETRIPELDEKLDKIDVLGEFGEGQGKVDPGAKVDVPSNETGTRGLQVREAHNIGVENGRARAIADGLQPSNWINPLEHRGGFGQGFDDIMLLDGEPVIVEYKGGEAGLSPGQLNREWVQRNIDLLREAGDNAMADRLQNALDSGTLEARVYSTPIDANGRPLGTMLDPPIYYPPAPPPPVAQPSRKNPSAEPDAIALIETTGEALDPQTLRYMEAHLDHDFDGIQIHTDTAAAESAEALHADAYAVDRDIYFAAGMYNPASVEGRELIAHELTHTRQRDEGHVPTATTTNGGGVAVARAGEPLEYEAQQAASSANGGRPIEPTALDTMQARFATHFDNVRIHDDADAAGWARGRNAQAFTIGRDIYFGQGKYAPASADGQRLLAHELAHTIQQNGAHGDFAPQAYSESPAANGASSEEREAGIAAAAAVAGEQVDTASLLRTVPALMPQLQAATEPADLYPDPIDVVWGGDPFHITFQRGTENALIFLEFVVEYTGPLATHSLSTQDKIVRVRAGIAESRLNASLRSKGPSSIAIDLYGWGDRIVHLEDHVSFENAAKGRQHDFSVRDTGRGSSGPILWVRDPKDGPIAKPDSPTNQQDVPGQVPASYLIGPDTTELRVDGDGDQAKELRVLLKATSFWPGTDPADATKGVHLSITQISSGSERVFDFEMPEPKLQGALFPLVEQVTDGRVPTKISLVRPSDSQWLSIWPPTPDAQGVSYTVEVPGHAVAFNFPPEKEPLRPVAFADKPGWKGGIAFLDFILGPYSDMFRLTVQSTAKLENKGGAKSIIGLTGLYHGKPTGGAFGMEMDVDRQPVLNVLDASGVSLKIDIDGNPAHSLQIFDQLTTAKSDDDPERNRYHNVRVVGQAFGDRVFYFSVREGGAPRGGVAHPSPADLAAQSNSLAISGLSEQIAQGDFDLELDSLDVIAFAATRKYAVAQNIIRQKTYDAWKAVSDSRLELRPMINAKQVDAAVKRRAAANVTELGTDLLEDSGSPSVAITAVTLNSQMLTDQWDRVDATYRSLMEIMDAWIVGRLKEVRGEHANETEQAKFIASRKAELGKITDKKPIRVSAVFQPDDPIQTRSGNEIKEMPLALYIWQDGGKWYLRDLTNPEKSYDYGPRAGDQPPIALFGEMDDPDHMPRGTIHFDVPSIYAGQLKVTHHLTLKQALTYAAMAAAIVGITLISFGTATGAATVAIYGGYALSASAVAGALAAGVDIAQGIHHGDLDLKRVVMDLGQIVAAAAGISQLRSGLIVREAMTAAEAGRPLTAAMAEYAVYHQKVYVVSSLIRGGADLTTLLVFEKTVYDQLVEIDRRPGSEPDKARARWLILAQIAGGLGMLTLSVNGILPSQLGGGRRLILHFPVEGGPPVANIGADVAPSTLKFSQRDVDTFTGDKSMTIDQLAESMRKNGWKGAGLNVVELEDGTLVSTDNRRLLAAQKAGLKTVPVAFHNPEEAFPPGRPGFKLENNIRQLDDGTLVKGGNKGKIVYRKGDNPKTWKEAALFRTANQGNLKEGGRFPLFGRYEQPFIRPPKPDTPPTSPAPTDD